MTQSPKNTDVKAMFNRLAPEYDRMNTVISLGTHRSWRPKVIQNITFGTDDRVLDVATGTADFALALAAASPVDTKIIGLDFSEEMLALGQKKVGASAYVDRIRLTQGNAEQLPFGDAQFSIVTTSFGLRNLPNPKRGLEEMYRVLKPGGQLVILEMSQPTNVFIKPFWKIYIGYIVPFLGRIFAPGRRKDYQYLDDTAENFMNSRDLTQLLETVGFHTVTTKRFNFGAVMAHYARK